MTTDRNSSMNELERIREFAAQTTCRNPELHAHCTRQDRDHLLAAIENVLERCDYWDTLAPGDQYYAGKVREAITSALEIA